MERMCNLTYRIMGVKLRWMFVVSLIIFFNTNAVAGIWDTAPTVDSNTMVLFTFNENEGLKVTNKAGIQVLDGMLQSESDMKENRTLLDTKFGGAFIFDGRNDFVKVPNHEKLSSPSQTFEIWCRIDDLEKQHFLLDHRIRAGNGIMLYIASGMLKATFGTKGELSSSIDSGWHYIAVNYNHETGIGKLFIDGVEESTSEFPGVNLIDVDTDLYIGCEDGNSGFFRGVIDEVRLSNIARAPTEISVSGNTIIIYPSNDSYVYNRFPDIPHDDKGIGLELGNYSEIYLQFNLNILEPDTKVISAQLRLHTTDSELQSGAVLSVKGCDNDWNGKSDGMGNEMTLTWNTKPKTVTEELATIEVLPKKGFSRFQIKEEAELVSFLNDCLSKDKVTSFQITYKSGGPENFFFDREGTGLRHHTGKENLSPQLFLVLDQKPKITISRPPNWPWTESTGSFIKTSGRDIQSMEERTMNFFPFGVFCTTTIGSQEDANLVFEDLAKHNMNFIYFGGGVTTREQVAYVLKSGEKYNIRVIFGFPGFGMNADAGYNRIRQEAKEYLNYFGKEILSSPSLLGYHVFDEPYLTDMPVLKKRVQVLFEEDPLHPAFYIPVGLDRIETSHKIAIPRDVFCPDVYPCANWRTLGDFGDIYRLGIDMLEYLDKAQVNFHPKDNTPMWVLLQTHYSSGNIGTREPTSEELRCTTWLSLAYGAKGLFYFLYNSVQEMDGLKDDPDDFEELRKTGERISKVGPVLLRLNRTKNLAEVKGGGSSIYPAGVVQTLIEDSPFREGVIIGQDGEFTLTKGVIAIKDDDASDGSAVKMPNSTLTHDIRWHWKKSLNLKPNVEYDLYATVKVDHNISGFNQSQGDAFIMGVYDESKKQDIIPAYSIPCDISKDMVYRAYKVGTFIPEEGQYVYIGGIGNKDIPDIYVDKFFFIEKGDCYLIVVNRNCKELDTLTVEINNTNTIDRYKNGKLEVIDISNNASIPIEKNKPFQFSLKLNAGEGTLVRLKNAE